MAKVATSHTRCLDLRCSGTDSSHHMPYLADFELAPQQRVSAAYTSVSYEAKLKALFKRADWSSVESAHTCGDIRPLQWQVPSQARPYSDPARRALGVPPLSGKVDIPGRML